MLAPPSTRRVLFARLSLAVFCPSCWLLLSQFPVAIMMERLPWERGGDWTQYCYQSKKILKEVFKDVKNTVMVSLKYIPYFFLKNTTSFFLISRI